MNKSVIGVLLVFLMVIGLAGGAAVYLLPKASPTKAGKESLVQRQPASSKSAPVPAIQQELNTLSEKMVAQLRQEERLNLSMVAQLRSYQEMMRQIEDYANRVERNLDMIEEISKDEFQEDVKLQASLFNGKKADLVAKHLEEFRASRVGAILAKMKDKEASAVLDIWAKQDDPKIGAFYREVMASFLNNKRRDSRPELFNQLKGQKKGVG